MRVHRVETAEAARALVPGAESVADGVAEIIAAVRSGGDAVLAEYVERFDKPAGGEPGALPPLDVAIANVRAVAEAQLGSDVEVTLPQGHAVTVRELPVRRAAIYVPGGRNPYPSTVVMGVVTAKAAGVDEVVVCAPGGHAAIRAAADACGADEIHDMGGAHAIAALAYGTETIARVDVIAGPGNLWVQEAKRQVSGDVGIDGFLGPSDVLVLAAERPDLVAADLRAQAEHGEGTIVCCASPDAGLLDDVEQRLADAPETGAVAALVHTDDLLAFAEAFAPEHLELIGTEELAADVRSAGCVFVGASGGTAFGDYVAGSNHSLPTGGTARFASALGPRAFRRRMSVVTLGAAASELAQPGAALARAEGFEQHARSMELRENQDR